MLNYRPYRYNDVKLFIILIPLISSINYYLTYTTISSGWRFVFTFLIDIQQGYVAWYCCRAIIIYLDKIYPYERNVARRILLQTSITTFVGLLVIILQTLLMHYLFSDRPFPLSFFTIDIVIIGIWFLVLNGIYIGLHYYTEYQESEDSREQEKMVRNQGFLVKYGKKNLSIPFAEIAGFTIENEYAVLTTTEPKSYYLDESLDAVEQKLPPELFFRLNRQSIVHRQMVAGFDRAENGKINVLLNTTSKFPQVIPVSRLKAPAFKNWFQPD